MALTSLIVSTDKDEYSRYEAAAKVVTAYIKPVGTGMYSVDVSVQLVKARRDRSVSVATKQVTITNSIPDSGAFEVKIDLENDPVSEVPDSKGLLLNFARRGKYFIRASAGTIVGESPDFNVTPLTLDLFKKTWLFGAAVQANDYRMARFQPTKVTGVEITEVSRNHPLDLYPLKLTVDSDGHKFLSWKKGEIVPTSAGTELVLVSDDRRQYIIVKTVPALLPNADVTESILIDKEYADDDLFRGFLDSALSELEESDIQAYVEPTILVSEADPSQIVFTTNSAGDTIPSLVPNADYDFIKNAVSHYPHTPGHWIHIQFPFVQLRHVSRLYGAIANTRIIEINKAWIEIQRQVGLVQLVPFQFRVAYDFIGLIWINALRGPADIPNMWHYNVIAGLDGCTPDILRALGLKAAIPALTLMGQAFRGGFSSQSVSRDGVSESASYTASAMYGIYSATIEQFLKELQKLLPQLRSRYRGINMWVA